MWLMTEEESGTTKSKKKKVVPQKVRRRKWYHKKYKVSAAVWPKEKTGHVQLHKIFYYECKNSLHLHSPKIITPIRQTPIAIT